MNMKRTVLLFFLYLFVLSSCGCVSKDTLSIIEGTFNGCSYERKELTAYLLIKRLDDNAFTNNVLLNVNDPNASVYFIDFSYFDEETETNKQLDLGVLKNSKQDEFLFKDSSNHSVRCYQNSNKNKLLYTVSWLSFDNNKCQSHIYLFGVDN